jgi:hypothetical protein
VYEDAVARQYVVGDDGEPLYGRWLPPADEPALVEDREPFTDEAGLFP